MTHTEPRRSISSSPKRCRDWPPRRRLVPRHRCHFVKQRLRLATQTTIELVRIERTASAKSPPKRVGKAALAKERHRWGGLRRVRTQRRILGDGRIKPSKIICHWLEARLLADCSGGNSRLSYPLGCGGRSFFGPKSVTDIKPHWGIEPRRGSFIFDLICGG